MKNPEFTTNTVPSMQLVTKEFETSRINPEDPAFDQLYSEHRSDMERVSSMSDIYDKQSPDTLQGHQAESLVYSLLSNHPVNSHISFRPTSLYDDYFHGADVLVEPRNARVQSVAAIDITTNQEDIKGTRYQGSEAGEARPIGLEAKLSRSRRYTEMLANYDPSRARDMSAWLESGGLHQPKNDKNQSMFRQAERLFLMKYYKTPEFDNDPGKPGFVIGGPQAVISIDTLFINKALQGNQQASDTIADLALLEFVYCIQAEQAYLDEQVKRNKDRNIFFDTHYSKVRAWSNIFDQAELSEMLDGMVAKNQNSREFREQISYYGKTFQKVLGH